MSNQPAAGGHAVATGDSKARADSSDLGAEGNAGAGDRADEAGMELVVKTDDQESMATETALSVGMSTHVQVSVHAFIHLADQILVMD